MNRFLNRLHACVGDLWWYSAMIFLACRSGDVIQAFIGLWLVPKYVGPQELGAVMPLQSLTSFLTVPLGIVAVVFAKYVNTYATRGEYGKVKSFIRDVFTCSFILFVLCIAGAYLIMPFFYERLRIASGSLTFLILLCGLVGNIGSIVGAAQQGLKRFKTLSVMTFLGAPIRLVTLLIAMPFRALSGYFLGQTTPGVVTTTLSALDIRKALAPYAPDPTWRRDLPEIGRYLWPIAILSFTSALFATVQITIYRQRLPEIESGAYYLLTRFAEVANYAGATLSVIIFPLASEAHESGKATNKILFHSLIGIAASTLALATVFYFLAPFILNMTPTWQTYGQYAHLLPLLTLNVGIGSALNLSSANEMACRRFGVPTFLMVSNLLWSVFLVSFTGYGFYHGILPDAIINLMASVHLATIQNLTVATVIYLGLQMTFVLFMVKTRKTNYAAKSGSLL